MAETGCRRQLPATRVAKTHRFEIAGHSGFIIVGLYPDGRPGEMFVRMSKAGSTLRGVMDALATTVSLGLQYGVPLEVLVAKFAYSRFEPFGSTDNEDLPQASSIVDYVFRWLSREFAAAVEEN